MNERSETSFTKRNRVLRITKVELSDEVKRGSKKWEREGKKKDPGKFRSVARKACCTTHPLSCSLLATVR
ncbi:hypothetical protein CA13_01060 [Planctomycetes bacterium CA13]|uniref:Uncharacterized protein n=1 Tax=Novipirellula herctigrandis TaxID=2527986 RepID=A0A5C5YUK0_9BACT|nr:hypothetical protein CA13_01060 [Planctomycetes bacterium CA13]